MSLTSKQAEQLAGVVKSLSTENFWASLCSILSESFDFDEIAVFQYKGSRSPIRLYDHRPRKARDRLHNDLLKAAYLIGPYYNNLVRPRAKDGYYHIDAIAPDAFSDSEYFRIYFKQKHVADEGMFYCNIPSGWSIGVLCERTTPAASLNAEELSELNDLSTLVAALICQHVQFSQPKLISEETNSSMATILESFGRSSLSTREKEIAELILRGHSSKSGARHLGISPETERVHRKRLYHKLNISSQSELFWFFIQSVDYYDPEQQNDPLEVLIANKELAGGNENPHAG